MHRELPVLSHLQQGPTTEEQETWNGLLGNKILTYSMKYEMRDFVPKSVMNSPLLLKLCMLISLVMVNVTPTVQLLVLFYIIYSVYQTNALHRIILGEMLWWLIML